MGNLVVVVDGVVGGVVISNVVVVLGDLCRFSCRFFFSFEAGFDVSFEVRLGSTGVFEEGVGVCFEVGIEESFEALVDLLSFVGEGMLGVLVLGFLLVDDGLC